MLPADKYLFPGHLQVTPSNISRVLLIGSCMVGDFLQRFREINTDIEIEHIMFNHVAKLPPQATRPPIDYDLHVVQLPIRHIIGDRAIRFKDFSENADAFLKDAVQLLILMLDEALAYNERHNVLTIVSNFVVPQGEFVAAAEDVGGKKDLRSLVIHLNQELVRQLSKRRNVFLLDIETIAASIGKRYFLDDMISFSTHGGFWFGDWHVLEQDRLEAVAHIEAISPSHLTQFIDAVWRRIECIWRIANQIDQVKLVIFDLDDTMWRGIIGEHYGDEIQRLTVGWPHGMQEVVHHLKARGILTAVCSKNSIEIVTERWDRAVSEGFIALDDFTFVEINWSPKADSIARIMAAANLTAKSVVFVDDNPVERQSILAAFPDMRVLAAQPFETRRILLNAPETHVPRVTDETSLREASILRIQEREAERSSLSRDEFLASLECKVDLFQVASNTDDRFARALELINKTNQFNTTGERWTFESISELLEFGGEIWAFTVSDRHTAYGLVGVILMNDHHFTQFAMSCRVLGLEIEGSVIKQIINLKKAVNGASHSFSAALKFTKQNAPCRTVYDKIGFVREAHDMETLRISANHKLEIAPHIAIIGADRLLAQKYSDVQLPPRSPIAKYIIERRLFILSRILHKREVDRLRTKNFDCNFYLKTHGDVAEAGIDPIEHFVQFGRQEGRRVRFVIKNP